MSGVIDILNTNRALTEALLQYIQTVMNISETRNKQKIKKCKMFNLMNYLEKRTL